MEISCLYSWNLGEKESYICLGTKHASGNYHLIVASFEFPSYFKELTVLKFDSAVTRVSGFHNRQLAVCEGKNLDLYELPNSNSKMYFSNNLLRLSLIHKVSFRNKITTLTCVPEENKLYVGDQKDGVIMVKLIDRRLEMVKFDSKMRAISSVVRLGEFLVGADVEKQLFILEESMTGSVLKQLATFFMHDICYQLKNVQVKPQLLYPKYSK